MGHGPMKTVQEEAYSRARSFKFAFEGWWFVIRTQHNAWIHAVASIFVFLLGVYFQITRVEWGLVVAAVMAVWMGEFLNTAVEAVVDMISPEVHPLAKVAKDVSAAAVLIGAGGAVLIGLLVFGPRVWTLLAGS